METMETKEKEAKIFDKEFLKIFVKEILIALIIALVIMQFFKPTIIKETSMEPTLHENDYVILNKQAYRFGELERGDIIVFKSDLTTMEGEKKLLIKRVIGLPGDLITINEGSLYINDEEIKESYIKDGYTTGWIENLTVPEGQIFVMGDNREVSLDSRSSEVGCVKIEDIVGKASFRLYPFDQIKSF